MDIVGKHHFGAIRLTRLDSRGIRAPNHHDFGRRPHHFRRERRRNRMISGAHGGHAIGEQLGRQALQRGQGSTGLERSGALQELQFRKYAASTPECLLQRRAPNDGRRRRLLGDTRTQCADFRDIWSCWRHYLC